MEVRDGRGENKTKEFQKNQARVSYFFKEFPGETARNCSYYTGLSYKTVLNHIKKLKEQ